MTPEVIERERPDALLPTLGGQTGLNLTVELAEAGVLSRFGVELIGADVDAINELLGHIVSGGRAAQAEIKENRHELKVAANPGY